MNQKKVTGAYVALARLNAVQLHIKDAYNVYKLKKQLEDTYLFMVAEQQKIVEKYKGTILGDGNIQFESNEIAMKAQKELQELNEADIDIDVQEVSVRLDEVKGGTMSPNDMEALEGFISFV